MTDWKPSKATLDALAALSIKGNVTTIPGLRSLYISCKDGTRISSATLRAIRSRGLIAGAPIPRGHAYWLNDDGAAVLAKYRPNTNSEE